MTLSLAARGTHWGDRTAVVDISAARRESPERYTYAELASIAAALESDLADRGIGPGDTVVLLSRNRVRTLAVVFACRRLGATFAPVSHRHTPATVAGPVEQLGPALVLAESAQGDLLSALPEGTPTVTFGGRDAAESPSVDPDPEPPGDRRAERDDTPLVSLPVVSEPSEGSGLESIAEFSPEAVEATCRSVVTTWGLGRADRTPLTLPLSAPGGLLRVALPTLYAGGTLLLDRAFDPADVVSVLREEPVTVLAGRTADLRGLAEAGFPEAAPDCEFVVADAGVPAELRAEYRERGLPVRRAYGAPICPTILSGPATDGGEAEGVGRPAFDCRVRLVDDGALEVAGPMVGTRREGVKGDGWHPTGDRFRRDDEGRYHLVGSP